MKERFEKLMDEYYKIRVKKFALEFSISSYCILYCMFDLQ